MTQLREDLQRRGEVQALSRARIQPMCDGVQLALRVARQVCALGQVLAQQLIGILMGPALPGAVRIGKEHPDGEALGQALVLRQLLASIIGQRFAQRGWHMPEFLGEALSSTRGISPITVLHVQPFLCKYLRPGFSLNALLLRNSC